MNMPLRICLNRRSVFGVTIILFSAQSKSTTWTGSSDLNYWRIMGRIMTSGRMLVHYTTGLLNRDWICLSALLNRKYFYDWMPFILQTCLSYSIALLMLNALPYFKPYLPKCLGTLQIALIVLLWLQCTCQSNLLGGSSMTSSSIISFCQNQSQIHYQGSFHIWAFALVSVRTINMYMSVLSLQGPATEQ